MQISSTDLSAALTAAIAGGYVAEMTAQTYTVTSPIVIDVTSTIQGPLGIDLGGAHIVSQITDGSPVIQINVGPGVDLRYLTFSNFTIDGNGREGDGIKIVADGNDRWVYNFTIDDVTVKNVGGYGLNVQGSVFEGLVTDSSMIGNAKGGAYFTHSSGGGQVSALRWFGGTFENNGGAGLILGNGARDMSVDSVSFVHNNGVGISAEQGVTSVTDSQFTDNKVAGIWFQNFGNFSGNTFINSGVQGTGITGWLNGAASVIDSTSIYTGSGSDPTVLASLQGYGWAYMEGDVGRTVTGSNIVVSGPGAGNNAEVTVSSQGVALPTVEHITAATTAALANSTGTGMLETTLRAALTNGTVAELSGTSFTVTSSIVINLTKSSPGPIGVDLGGAKILSQITNGAPVIEIIVGGGVDVAALTLTNFMIQGNGREGAGIKIVADGADRSIKLNLDGVNVEHVGGIGIDAIGNVSGTVFDSWMHGNLSGGARFADSSNGGTADGLQWIGGGFRKNGVAGLILDNGARDMTVQGAYFVDNDGPGIDATNGIALVQQSGFENNGGMGALVQGAATFLNDTFSTYGVQQTAIGGYLSGQQITLIGSGNEYYGWNTDNTVLANIQGSGTLSLAGGGRVIASSGISMGGLTDLSAVPPPADTTSPAITSTTASGPDIVEGAGNLGAGKTVILTVTFSEAVIVSGGPFLQLNDGGWANYVSGSGTTALTFSHVVQTGQNAADLVISFFSLNGGTIRDAAGNAADLAGAAGLNPAGTLKVDTTAPTVASIGTSGTSITAGSGTVGMGEIVTVMVVMNETVVVTGTPMLALNDGGTATYTGGSGSTSLTFSHVVQADQNAADLIVTGVALNGGAIRDPAGNAANFSAAANYNPPGTLKIDTTTLPAASVSIVELSAVKPEGHNGTTSFTFVLIQSGDTSAPHSVSWSVFGLGANAADASDFAGGSLPVDTLTFAPGETSKALTLLVAGDALVELGEFFMVSLSNPSAGLTIGAGAAIGEILNDDVSTASIASLTAANAEGNNGSTPFTFTVSLSQPVVVEESVYWAVTGSGDHPANPADFGGDPLSGTVRFAPGEISKAITIGVAGDTEVEMDEGFIVSLSAPSVGLSIATGAAAGTILNDDSSTAVHIVAANDAYVILQDSSLIVAGAGGVLFNDDATSPLTATMYDGPDHGTAQLKADGSLFYTPTAGFTGIDSFLYSSSDATGVNSEAHGLIYVVPVSAGPTATLNVFALTPEEQIATTYTAFFGRGADANGFRFWVHEFQAGVPQQGPSALFANIASSFGASDEAKAMYTFLANPNDTSDRQISAFLDTVYNNLFNRSSDAAGLGYWTGQIKQTLAGGKFVGSVLVDIIAGTQVGPDLAALMGKVAVGLEFVLQQETNNMQWNGASDQAAATALLHAVTSDLQSVLIGIKNADALTAAHA